MRLDAGCGVCPVLLFLKYVVEAQVTYGEALLCSTALLCCIA